MAVRVSRFVLLTVLPGDVAKQLRRQHLSHFSLSTQYLTQLATYYPCDCVSPYDAQTRARYLGRMLMTAVAAKSSTLRPSVPVGRRKQSQRGTRPNTQLHEGGKIRENVGVSTIIFCLRLHAGGFGRLR